MEIVSMNTFKSEHSIGKSLGFNNKILQGLKDFNILFIGLRIFSEEQEFCDKVVLFIEGFNKPLPNY